MTSSIKMNLSADFDSHISLQLDKSIPASEAIITTNLRNSIAKDIKKEIEISINASETKMNTKIKTLQNELKQQQDQKFREFNKWMMSGLTKIYNKKANNILSPTNITNTSSTLNKPTFNDITPTQHSQVAETGPLAHDDISEDLSIGETINDNPPKRIKNKENPEPKPISQNPAL
mmetsp:Transcript_14778/g.21107  ORF Transcript_14778/g.21107 Transcript_14778/m.21107 type:complete len:176 (+) Transcript_14778:1861-2388(+)